MSFIEASIGMQPVSVAVLLAEMRREQTKAGGAVQLRAISSELADVHAALAAALLRSGMLQSDVKRLEETVEALRGALQAKDERLWLIGTQLAEVSGAALPATAAATGAHDSAVAGVPALALGAVAGSPDGKVSSSCGSTNRLSVLRGMVGFLSPRLSPRSPRVPAKGSPPERRPERPEQASADEQTGAHDSAFTRAPEFREFRGRRSRVEGREIMKQARSEGDLEGWGAWADESHHGNRHAQIRHAPMAGRFHSSEVSSEASPLTARGMGARAHGPMPRLGAPKTALFVLKEGVLTKLSKGGFTANWNRRAFALIGSSLFYAKDREHLLNQPKLFAEVAGCVCSSWYEAATNRNNTLAIQLPNLDDPDGDSEVLIMAADTVREKLAWIEAITHAARMPPCPIEFVHRLLTDADPTGPWPSGGLAPDSGDPISPIRWDRVAANFAAHDGGGGGRNWAVRERSDGYHQHSGDHHHHYGSSHRRHQTQPEPDAGLTWGAFNLESWMPFVKNV